MNKIVKLIMMFFMLVYIFVHSPKPSQALSNLSEPEQWFYNDININQAWDLGFTGRNVGVVVLDTGFGSSKGNQLVHEDLNVNIGNCSSDLDCIIKNEDLHGHGTHVTGIIGGKHNGIGMKGISPSVNMYSVKVFFEDTSGINIDSLLSALKWINDNRISKKIKVVNMSFGWSEGEITDELINNAIHNEIKELLDNDVSIVVAVGNSGSEFPYISNVSDYPTNYDPNRIITVGSINKHHDRFLLFMEEVNLWLAFLRETNISENVYSSTGQTLDIVAPGKDILSSYPYLLDWEEGSPVRVKDEQGNPIKGNYYALMPGTSLAAPIVTGIIALYHEMYPEKNAEQIRQLLFNSAKKLNGYQKDDWDWEYGHGLVQALPEKPVPFEGEVTLYPTHVMVGKPFVVYEYPSMQADIHVITEETKKVNITRAWKEKEQTSAPYKEYEWYEIELENGERYWAKSDFFTLFRKLPISQYMSFQASDLVYDYPSFDAPSKKYGDIQGYGQTKYSYDGFNYNANELRYMWYSVDTKESLKWYPAKFNDYVAKKDPDSNGFGDGKVSSWNDYITSDTLQDWKNRIISNTSYDNTKAQFEEKKWFNETEFNHLYYKYKDKYPYRYVVYERHKNGGNDVTYLAFSTSPLYVDKSSTRGTYRTNDRSSFVWIDPMKNSSGTTPYVEKTATYIYTSTTNSSDVEADFYVIDMD